MRRWFFLFAISFASYIQAQSAYDLAKRYFASEAYDSARLYVDQHLKRAPMADGYFLSGMIHHGQGNLSDALLDYEATIRGDAFHLDAYFQKGRIYYEMSSMEEAIRDFTYIIANHSGAETKAVYFSNNLSGKGGTTMVSLQNLLGRVYQYRGLAHQELGRYEHAMKDFNTAFRYDTASDYYINRALLHVRLGDDLTAVRDLRSAIALDAYSYLAWYNLLLLDPSTEVPEVLLANDDFSPLYGLLGANAFQLEQFEEAVLHYDQAISITPENPRLYIEQGKVLMRLQEYERARKRFVIAESLDGSLIECLLLIGNSFFHQKNYENAKAFYELFLSKEQTNENAYFNAAMTFFNLKELPKGCLYLKKAARLGMDRAKGLMTRYCEQ